MVKRRITYHQFATLHHFFFNCGSHLQNIVGFVFCHNSTHIVHFLPPFAVLLSSAHRLRNVPETHGSRLELALHKSKSLRCLNSRLKVAENGTLGPDLQTHTSQNAPAN